MPLCFDLLAMYRWILCVFHSPKWTEANSVSIYYSQFSICCAIGFVMHWFVIRLIYVAFSEAKTQLEVIRGQLQGLRAWLYFRPSLLVLQHRLWKGTARLDEYIKDRFTSNLPTCSGLIANATEPHGTLECRWMHCVPTTYAVPGSSTK